MTALLVRAEGSVLSLRHTAEELGGELDAVWDAGTRFHWLEERHVGSLLAGAILRVRYEVADEGDAAVARDVVVLLQGEGAPLTGELLPPTVH
jgi:hypothetical protein